MKPRKLLRGEVWRADLDPVRGHEQSGIRPVIIVSENTFNKGPAQLCFAVPVTSKDKGVLWHVPIAPPEGGLSRPSWAKCEDLRSLSLDRFFDHMGDVSDETMEAVEYRLRVLLKL